MLAIDDQLIDPSFTYLNCQIYNDIVTAESDLIGCGGLMMSLCFQDPLVFLIIASRIFH